MNDTWWVDPNELNDEQQPIINLPIGDSYLITGPPGSGKTNLVLLRANYLYLSGIQNIEVIVFTRTLQEFIGSGGDQYDFPVAKVRTGVKFFQKLLHRYGVSLVLPDNFAKLRVYLLEEAQKLVADKNLADLFETILLDEGHNFWPAEIDLFSRLAKTMFIAADARQRIYDGADSIENMRQAVDKEFALQFHYRIGRQICKVADALMNDSPDYVPMLQSSQYDEVKIPSHVQIVECQSVAAQVDKMIESLKVELATYPDEFVGVLNPTRRVLNEVRDIIRGSDLGDLAICQGDTNAVNFTPERRIVVCTIHAAQGVEFRTVHIAGADEIERLHQHRNAIFTAVTRAKTSLSVYHSSTLPGYFEQALQTAQPAKPPAKLQDVFRGKRKS